MHDVMFGWTATSEWQHGSSCNSLSSNCKKNVRL